ncbi:hypothetical protein GE09DRAFT_774553 [Coniochaeta sp. 2T2.1]|nr:hypothetical protein GE09DRAFT_774553 [Coniochaeta sp. 2T2.1]
MAQQEVPVYLGQWPQHAGLDYRYALVDGVGMRLYKPQPDSSEPVQRQIMYSQYATNTPHAALPMPPTYEHLTPVCAFSNLVLTENYGDPTLGSGFTRHYDPRWNLPSLSTGSHGLPVVQDSAYPQGAGENSVCEVPPASAMVKAEFDPRPSPTRTRKRKLRAIRQGSPPAQLDPQPTCIEPSKTITTVGPLVKDRPTDNPIDSLLAVVHAKPDMPACSSIVIKADTVAGRRKRPPPEKRHHCSWEGCQKRFAHKAQLENHARSHTGEKPFPCGYAGCDRWFSQSGNRNTHRRGHTGEAPFKCPICERPFRSGGNVRPHMETHFPNKTRWVCRLDSCTVSCSSKGNLKNHQEQFHQKTLAALNERFRKVNDFASAPEDDREIAMYLATIHNNANKGIKGCGGSRIRRLPITPPSSPKYSAPSTPISAASYDSPQFPAQHGLPGPFSQFPPLNYSVSHMMAPFSQSSRKIMSDANIHVNINMCYSDDDSNMASPISMASPASTAPYGDDSPGRLVISRRFY